MKEPRPSYLFVSFCQSMFIFMLWATFIRADRGIVDLKFLVIGILFSIIGFFSQEFETMIIKKWPHLRSDPKYPVLFERKNITSAEYILLVAVAALIVFKCKDVVSLKFRSPASPPYDSPADKPSQFRYPDVNQILRRTY